MFVIKDDIDMNYVVCRKFDVIVCVFFFRINAFIIFSFVCRVFSTMLITYLSLLKYREAHDKNATIRAYVTKRFAYYVSLQLYLFAWHNSLVSLSLSFFLSCRRPTKDRVELFNIRRCDGFVSPVTAFDHDTDSVGKSLPGIRIRRAFPLKVIFLCYEALPTYVSFISTDRNISAHLSIDWFYPIFLFLKHNKTYSNILRNQMWMIYDFS